MTTIVLLNWNGWKDTIECLKSIKDISDVEVSTIIVDNGSTDESIIQLTNYLHQTDNRFYMVEEGDHLSDTLQNKDVVLYKLNKNYGFAKGNNLGLQLLSEQPIDYYWILNNDTEVEPQSLRLLSQFMNNHNDYIACTPQIRYYYDKNIIWNCGGKLCWGFRKYYYPDQSNIALKKEFFDISFITGCALFVRPSALSNNSLFTERFFFGEEDFELSMRWKQENQKVACLTSSIIYHKVSASTQTRNELPKIYIHYLNRYINIKQHFGRLNYSIWKLVNNIWIFMLLIKKNYSAGRAISFLSKLNKESMQRDCVDYDYFINTLNGTVI